MDSTKRLLLALALSFAVTAVYMWLTPKPPQQELVEVDGGIEAVAKAPSPVTAVAAPAPSAPGEGLEAAPPPAEVKQLTHKEVDVNYVVSTAGAGLVQAELQGEKMREQRQLNMSQG